jgi:hypothetical protein
MAMPELDYQKLAKAIAEEMREHPAACLMGWKPEDIATLSQFAATLRKGFAAASYILVASITAGTLAAIWAGLKQLVKAPS